MKYLSLITCMLVFIYSAHTQQKQQPTLYPLKVYMAVNHAPMSFGFFDSTGKRITIRVGLPLNNDSVLFHLPQGKLIMRIILQGKPLNVYIEKRPQPDTIRFH